MKAMPSSPILVPPSQQRLHKSQFLHKVSYQKPCWDQARLSSLVKKQVADQPNQFSALFRSLSKCTSSVLHPLSASISLHWPGGARMWTSSSPGGTDDRTSSPPGGAVSKTSSPPGGADRQTSSPPGRSQRNTKLLGPNIDWGLRTNPTDHFAAACPQRSQMLPNFFLTSFYTVDSFNYPGYIVRTPTNSVQYRWPPGFSTSDFFSLLELFTRLDHRLCTHSGEHCSTVHPNTDIQTVVHCTKVSSTLDCYRV